MLHITFEFVGGPNDGRVVQGRLGEPCDAERHYLFSNHGRLGQRFAVASDYAIEVLTGEAKDVGHTVQRHYYVVTDRREKPQGVHVRAEYDPPREARRCPPPQPAASTGLSDLRGHLLIASPRMEDPLYEQSVVLVLDQNEDELFGVILNHPTPATVSQLWQELSEAPCSNPRPVYVGGPEDGPVAVLHTNETAADTSVALGVFLSMGRDNVESVVHQSDVTQRFLLGTASWDAEQLEEEFANGDWLALPATNELVFADPEAQWRTALRAFGHHFYRSIGIRHLPDDPAVN